MHRMLDANTRRAIDCPASGYALCAVPGLERKVWPMIANWDAAKFWMDFVNLALVVVLGIYTWFINKGKAASAEVKKAEQQRSALASRMDIIEERIEHLPNDRDIERIHERIDEVSNQLGKISGSMEASNRQLTLISEHLINRERK